MAAGGGLLEPRRYALPGYAMTTKEYNRAYYAARKLELAAKALARYHSNADAWKAANKKWRQDNPDKSRARNRASWRRHATKRIRESIENARKKPIAKRARSHAYRARQREAAGRFTAAEFEAKIAAQNGKCFYCRSPLVVPVAEHMIPLCRGGSNWIDNIVASCQSCNCSKGKKTHIEFLAMHFQATQ